MWSRVRNAQHAGTEAVGSWLASDPRNLDNWLPSIQPHTARCPLTSPPSFQLLQGNKSTKERKYQEFQRMVIKENFPIYPPDKTCDTRKQSETEARLNNI
jgi:hypothetical protein